MKTKTNNVRNFKLTAVFFLITAMFGTTSQAQSDAGSNTESLDEVFNRLEILMSLTEVAIQYVVPSVDDADVFEATERMEFLAQETENTLRYEAPQAITAELTDAVYRLELLASKTENEIRYRVSDAEVVIETDPGSIEFEEDQDNHHLLAFHIAKVKNSLTR